MTTPAKRHSKATISKRSNDAGAALRARKLSVLAMLETLKSRVEALPNETTDWGMAGSLGHVEEQLFELIDQ